MDTFLRIIPIIILIALSAFFSATETAFSSLNKIRLKNYANAGNKHAKLALKISNDFDTAISTILIGNNIVNIASASLGTLFFVELVGEKIGVSLSTIAMTIVVLIFGEVMPKSIAKENPEKFALTVCGILNFLMIIFKPFSFLLGALKKLLIRKNNDGHQSPSVTEEELKYIIEEIEDEGVLEEHESELVQSALDFDDITVSEILTPRVDVCGVDITDYTIEEIKNMFIGTGFSRLPVYEKTIDNIIGFINQKDFFKSYIVNNQVNIKQILQKVVYVPPKKLICELLKELQRNKTHIAVVTDQYGGTLGIVTLEDIIEELVGEIWDESDRVVASFEKLGENIYRVNPDVNIYDLFDELEIDNFDGASQSIGAWALENFEKLPNIGDSFTYENVKVTVERISEQRILSLTIEVTPIVKDDDE